MLFWGRVKGMLGMVHERQRRRGLLRGVVFMGVGLLLLLAPMVGYAKETSKEVLWQAAITQKVKGNYLDAAEAFMLYCEQGTNQVRKIEALVRAAECYDCIRQSKKAKRLYERVIRDETNKRKAPKIYEEAYNLLHLHLLNKSERAVERGRLVREARRNVGDPKIRSVIYEREADALLAEGDA